MNVHQYVLKLAEYVHVQSFVRFDRFPCRVPPSCSRQRQVTWHDNPRPRMGNIDFSMTDQITPLALAILNAHPSG